VGALTWWHVSAGLQAMARMRSGDAQEVSMQKCIEGKAPRALSKG